METKITKNGWVELEEKVRIEPLNVYVEGTSSEGKAFPVDSPIFPFYASDFGGEHQTSRDALNETLRLCNEKGEFDIHSLEKVVRKVDGTKYPQNGSLMEMIKRFSLGKNFVSLEELEGVEISPIARVTKIRFADSYYATPNTVELNWEQYLEFGKPREILRQVSTKYQVTERL